MLPKEIFCAGFQKIGCKVVRFLQKIKKTIFFVEKLIGL